MTIKPGAESYFEPPHISKIPTFNTEILLVFWKFHAEISTTHPKIVTVSSQNAVYFLKIPTFLVTRPKAQYLLAIVRVGACV